MLNETTKNLLKLLSNQLRDVRSPLVKMFQEGVSKSFIKKSLKKREIIIELPEEVYALFKWHNGLLEQETSGRSLGEIWLFPLAAPLEIEGAMDSYQYYAISNPYWKKSLFPLFESGGGDYYLIDCDRHSKTYRMILLFSFSITFGEVEVMYDSLNDLIKTITECFLKQAYFYGMPSHLQFVSGPILESNEELAARISQKYNHQSDHWVKLLEALNRKKTR